MKFPSVRGVDLNGRSLALPSDLGPGSTFAIVAFDLGQRAQIESWQPFLRELGEHRLAQGRLFAVYARALETMSGMMRSALRAAAPDERVRAATFLMAVDLDVFCAALEIRDQSLVHALLIDPTGDVVASECGAFAAEAGRRLEVRLRGSL